MVFGLINKYRLFTAFMRVIRNPMDVAEFNQRTDELLDRSLFSDTLSRLNKDQASKYALEKRVLIQTTPPEAFHFFSKKSLGHAYKEFLIQNKIVVQRPLFDRINPVGYLRYRYRSYNHIWRVLLGYDLSVEGQIALHSFLFAQTHSVPSAIYLALSLLHGAFFQRSALKTFMAAILDGWKKGHEMRLVWGLPLEEHFKKDLEEIRRSLMKAEDADSKPILQLAH